MTNALYPVTPGQTHPPLASDINQLVNLLNGLVDAGVLTLAAPISAPSNAGITGAAQTGTTLGVGAYRYQFTYVVGVKKSDNTVTLGGETLPSTAVAVTTTTGNQAIKLSGLPTSWPATAVALRIYRTALGGADGTQKLVATITTAVTTYTDTTADGALGSTVPTTNTTGTTLSNYVDQSTAQTIGGAKTFTSQIVDSSVQPGLIMIETDGTAGIKGAKLITDGDTIYMQVVSDDGTTWVRNLFSIAKSNGNAKFLNGSFSTVNNTLDDGSGAATFASSVTANGNVFAVGGTVQAGNSIANYAQLRYDGYLGRATGGGSPSFNNIWDDSRLRTTNGYVEWNKGGVWYPVGGVSIGASSTVQYSNTTEYTITSNASGQWMLVAKFVPKGTGDMIVTCDLLAPGGSNSAGLYVGNSGPNNNEVPSLADWTTPLGTVVGGASTGNTTAVIPPSGTGAYVTQSATLRVHEKEPVYLYMYNASTISGATIKVRNIYVKYDVLG